MRAAAAAALADVLLHVATHALVEADDAGDWGPRDLLSAAAGRAAVLAGDGAALRAPPAGRGYALDDSDGDEYDEEEQEAPPPPPPPKKPAKRR